MSTSQAQSGLSTADSVLSQRPHRSLCRDCSNLSPGNDCGALGTASPFPAGTGGNFSHNHRQCWLHWEVSVGTTHRAPSHTLISVDVRACVCPHVRASLCAP